MMLSSYEALKSHIDYKMEDVRKTAEQCKKRKKKHNGKGKKVSFMRFFKKEVKI